MSNSDHAKNLRSISSSAGTTQLNFNLKEDLGGGTSVLAKVETDWSDLGGNTQANGTSSAQQTGFANSENYLGVTSNWGLLRLGTPNTYTLTNQTAVAAPLFSTAIGSVDSTQYSLFNGLGTGISNFGGVVQANAGVGSGGASSGARDVRIANTVQYESPNFNGFKLATGITPQNNNVTTNLGSGNTVGVNEYALRYTQGPFDAMFTSIKYNIGSNGTSYSFMTVSGGVMTPVGKAMQGTYTNTHNLLGANYAVLPNLKLNAGLANFGSSDSSAKGKSFVYGGTYSHGSFDFLLLTSKVTDQNAYSTQFNRTMTGLGVNYNLSKASRLYLRYDNINYAQNQTSFNGSTQNRTALGMSTTF